MIRIAIADDHDLVRTGLKRLLQDFEDIDVVAEASDGYQALQVAEELKPDVILMDLNMPGLNGLEATQKMKKLFPAVKIIVVSMHNDELTARRLLNAGVDGYLTKDNDVAEINVAIHTVVTGKSYLSLEMAQKLALYNSKSNGHESPFKQLSTRELQVMDMIIDGKKVNEISDKLCLSPKTISTYRHRVFLKLGVNNDMELAKLAIQYGVIAEPPV